jgi:crotonobetainyl-CoA:carnitine CoA-transferase CaiB-like acyl-CoA transferase
MADELPLAGVKVLDFMWVMAGPSATRVLADYGATVVRVESTRRVDTARTMGPFHSGLPGPDNSAFFQTLNAGKLGITLDLSQEAGRAVARDLARWADVVCESFTPGVMRGWRLDYDSLRAIKPDLIMLSTCLMGQSGPLAGFAGFGSLAAAISGYYDIVGWPDRPPAGPFGAYTDTIAPRFTAVAILAALEHRRRTGEGQYIDQSQAEASLQFLSTALLDYAANGRVQTRRGNDDDALAPHGVYPAAGGERWIAIAVEDDAQWRALCDALGQAALADDQRFSTQAARLAHRAELDAALADATASRAAGELEAALQARGVPASVVEGSDDLFADAQLIHRDHFAEVAHPQHGTVHVEGSRFRLSRTPARIERAAPTLGGDSQYVLETLLGYSPERIAGLVAAGVLE